MRYAGDLSAEHADDMDMMWGLVCGICETIQDKAARFRRSVREIGLRQTIGRGLKTTATAAVKGIRNYLQHRLNPLHVYCRAMDCGLGNERARQFSRTYERFIYKLIL